MCVYIIISNRDSVIYLFSFKVDFPSTISEALNDLVICRVDRSSGKARGGDEVFLLCEKVTKGKG